MQPVTSVHPRAMFSPYGPPECEKLHSVPLNSGSGPMDTRYAAAKPASVSFQETAAAPKSARMTLVLLRTADVKAARLVNSGALEAMVGEAVTVMVAVEMADWVTVMETSCEATATRRVRRLKKMWKTCMLSVF